jgi:hypothetical protein
MMELKNFSTRFCPKGTYSLKHQGCYDRDNRLHALVLFDSEDMPAMKVTVFIDGVDVPPDHILVKSWSENEGLFEALVAAGVVHQVATLIPTGYVNAHLCKLTDKAIKELYLE